MSATLGWILTGGLLMSAVAMIGGATTVIRRERFDALLLPLVALAAGTLLGGAFFHMVPTGLTALQPVAAGAWLLAGFSSFLAVEQFLHWHHSHGQHRQNSPPRTILVLIGDGLHNWIGGLSIASTFLLDPHAGRMAWLAALAHEIPQELGDFGVLVYGGWSRGRALRWNLLSALMFPLGALTAYAIRVEFSVAGLVLFGAGNFVYLAASDLVPEIKGESRLLRAVVHTGSFGTGILLMYVIA